MCAGRRIGQEARGSQNAESLMLLVAADAGLPRLVNVEGVAMGAVAHLGLYLPNGDRRRPRDRGAPGKRRQPVRPEEPQKRRARYRAEGLDGQVFTAGIGENSPKIPRRILEASAWLGIKIDSGANKRQQTHLRRREQGVGLGHPDQRRADDRPPHRRTVEVARPIRLIGFAYFPDRARGRSASPVRKNAAQ